MEIDCIVSVNSFRKCRVAMTQFDWLLQPWRRDASLLHVKSSYFGRLIGKRDLGAWLLCLQLWKLLILLWVPCSPGMGDLMSLKWVLSSSGKQPYKIGEKSVARIWGDAQWRRYLRCHRWMILLLDGLHFPFAGFIWMEVVLLNAPRKENGVLTSLSVLVSLWVPNSAERD